MSAGEARDRAPGPRWYRLPDESWAMIRAEYLAGATAKQLAVKWGVSPTSVYRHACADGFTKARRGEAINLEAVTRFAAEAAAAEARAAAAARAEVEAQAAAARRAREEEAEADPAEAATTLLRRAAGAAMAGKLERAQALLRLAEGLGRTAAPAPPRSARDAPAFEPPDRDEQEDAERDAFWRTPEGRLKEAAMREQLGTRLAELFDAPAPPRSGGWGS